MRIDAVSTIVGAHEAREAASRLTMPVSDGSGRARILARPPPRLPAADADHAGRRLAPVRPPVFPVAASRQATSQRSPRTLRRTPLGQGKTS